MLKKRLANKEGEEKDMVDEMTELITEDLKQTAHLKSDEYELIAQKLAKLSSSIPQTEEWKKYLPWFKAYKHLEYTCDFIQSKSSEDSFE